MNKMQTENTMRLNDTTIRRGTIFCARNVPEMNRSERNNAMKQKAKRKPMRLREYDYSEAGCYYVTMCTHNKQNLFGKIRRGTIFCARNEGGNIAQRCWEEIPKHYPNVELDEFVVMLNHIHGIMIINKRAHDKKNGHKILCPYE